MWLYTVHWDLYNVSFVYEVRKIRLKVIKILDIMQNVFSVKTHSLEHWLAKLHTRQVKFHNFCFYGKRETEAASEILSVFNYSEVMENVKVLSLDNKTSSGNFSSPCFCKTSIS